MDGTGKVVVVEGIMKAIVWEPCTHGQRHEGGEEVGDQVGRDSSFPAKQNAQAAGCLIVGDTSQDESKIGRKTA